MMYLALLRRFGPYIAGALILLGVFMWYRGQINEAEARGYLKAQAEFQTELDKEREHQREINEEIDREHYAEKTELQKRVRRLLARNDAIRLCEPSSEVRDAASPGEPDAASGDDGQALRAGQDIGPRLVEYGASCEGLRQQLEGWQRWYAEHAQNP
jgi:hypothetical protein